MTMDHSISPNVNITRIYSMIQLLLYAHSDPENTHFIFISDSAIPPVKTFDQVYTDLVNDQTSRFWFDQINEYI